MQYPNRGLRASRLPPATFCGPSGAKINEVHRISLINAIMH
jgi:hypothetical protein